MRSDETPGTADRRSACTRAVEALGHDVERDEPFLLGGGQGAFPLGYVRVLEDPRLVDEWGERGVDEGCG
jgi:hypothetical protein